ncbi:MAG: type IV toxin-antitoxin system AbiEi family antitoxin domain-containing protein [Candidatus Longimicrobiales bacterium M2_2A_002]
MAAREVERGTMELARRQHGVVTRRQLLELGLDPRAITRRARSRQWARLFRGTYVVGPITPPRAREMAAVLACGPKALISHRSATGLWNVCPAPSASDPVDVTVVGRCSEVTGLRTRGAVALADDERARVDGIPVTSIGRTLVDFAAVASMPELEGAVARAEREGLITPPALGALLARYRRRPGIPALRAVLTRSGGPALVESEAEKIFLRDIVRKGDLPAPRTNAEIGGYRLDFYWEEHGVAVEIDGFRWHGNRPRFDSDRRRITRLAAAGIQVIPMAWSQIVDEPTATAVLVGKALLRAELARGVRL